RHRPVRRLGSHRNADASADGRVIAARSVGGLITVWVRRPGKAPRVWHILGAQALAVDVADDGSGVLLVEAKATSFTTSKKIGRSGGARSVSTVESSGGS